jgi:hypothetical protein
MNCDKVDSVIIGLGAQAFQVSFMIGRHDVLLCRADD